ncbi:YecA family protein [Bacillus sp. REN16]|uniref:YecA family protein n=1 Tax=Bacillus sp. REN16 TaxID=2887296 RepID=UPI001E3DDAC4|nr:SEC-C domain-containing protein [Bacillus sp. REN16]MCC3356159.1 SEC-C domain-containing protein [Bacillus sp. REN16]
MKVIGRNNLCTCGSGKKYKKCCGRSAVVSIDQVVENELNDIQHDLFQYALHLYDEFFDDVLDEYADIFDELPEDVYELFSFFSRVWVISSIPADDKTILEEYVDIYGPKCSRPRTRDLLQKWKAARPSAYTVTEVDEQRTYMTVRNIFTEIEHRVRIYETETGVEAGYFVFGTLLPAGTNSIFFPTFLELPTQFAGDMRNLIFDLFEKSPETNPVDFMSHEFINVFMVFMFGKDAVSVEDFDWKTTKQQEVAEMFQVRMKEYNYEEEIIGIGLSLWHQYCEQKNPRIIKTGIYEAALVYMVEQIYPYEGHSTQEELAKEYDVSPSSISAKFKELEKVLQEEIRKYEALVDAAEFDDDILWNDEE